MAAILAGVLVAGSPFARSESRESFDLAVPAPPNPVLIDGREWLVYELHLTNFSREPLSLVAIQVLEGGGGSLKSFEGGDLTQRMSIVAVPRAPAQPVQPGERAVAYLEVPVQTAPSALRHRVRYTASPGRDVSEIVGADVRVSARPRLVLGPPLRGGPWAAVYAWEWPRGHRRVFYTLDGRARLPGRFAIDWVRRDERGASARGDADVVKNSLGHRAEVLAVADASVAAVRDGMPESERVSANPKPSLDDAAGNYVALDLGDGRFALYEHLAPGSIRVSRGDRVRRGQVIAALGFTGSSTEPHLHFHVADSPAPLTGEGLPFELERFDVHGAGAPQQRRNERPAPNAVVSFDQ